MRVLCFRSWLCLFGPAYLLPLLFWPGFSLAQQAFTGTGGTVSGASGSVSYSVGQLAVGSFGGGGSSVLINPGVQQPAEWYATGTLLGGQVLYKNSVLTPMTNSQVLLRQGPQTLQSAGSSSTGAFQWGTVPAGSYTLGFTTSKPWGGGNATDALLISRHFSLVSALSGINLRAADVNGGGGGIVNGTDALQVSRRAALLQSSFGSGDWLWDPEGVAVGTGPGTQSIDMRTLCYGDVNGSYQPSVNQRLAMRPTGVRGERPLSSSAGVGLQPVTPMEVYLEGTEAQLGAITLELELPEGLRVEQVEMAEVGAGGQLVFNTVQQTLYILWYSAEGWQRQAGDPLFRIDVRGINPQPWTWGGISELADWEGQVLEDAGISMPRLTTPAASFGFDAWVYPNPAQGPRTLAYSLPEGGQVALRMSDLAGRILWERSLLHSGAGRYDEMLDMRQYAAGSYRLEVIYQGAQEQMVRVLQIVEVR